MDSEIKHLEITLLILGLLTAFGILYESYTLTGDIPSGAAFLAANPTCCGDCSCVNPVVCEACGCCFTTQCLDCASGLGPEGFMLFHPTRIPAGSSFTLYAVVKSESERDLLLDVKLPNGFIHEGENPVLVNLKPGDPEIVKYAVKVRDQVAEKNHIVRAQLLDVDWSYAGSARAMVSVYWMK